MPILLGPDLRLRLARRECIVNVRSIPWEMIADCEDQAQDSHQQDLLTLASRGGVSAGEAIAIMARVRPFPIDDILAHRILYAMRAMFARGQRVAEARGV
ncbi:hypothetical protein [Salinarimonas rosea]|uniref:hypothetical protein n=1 Tax=Salinarimonas rosea TaxID=552063 RepID=UPI00041C7361|nr:hypothetical protein [Salinarimonas rosea]